MIFAIDDVRNERVRPSATGQRAICPVCNGRVIAKCGEKMIFHWAHEVESGCKVKRTSQWHLNWQDLFPDKNLEVRHSHETEGLRIADVASKNMVIEIQRSPIDPNLIVQRTRFYREFFNKNVVWIFYCQNMTIGNEFKIGYPPRRNHWDETEIDFSVFRWDKAQYWKMPSLFSHSIVFLDFGKTVYRIHEFMPRMETWSKNGGIVSEKRTALGWGREYPRDVITKYLIDEIIEHS